MIREFRRVKGSKIWHLNENCPDWPITDYEIWYGVFVPPNCEQLCNVCYMTDKQFVKITKVDTSKTTFQIQESPNTFR